MGSGTFYPAASGDDGHWVSSSSFNSGIDLLIFGNNSGDNQYVFIRFASVTISQGATITGAIVRLTGYDARALTVCNANVYFNDHDNAVAPTTQGEGDALDLTGAIAWNALAAWADGTQYDTPELKTILQTVVDRGGFASGQAVMALIKDNSSDPAAIRAGSSYDYLAAAEKAELIVTWTANFEGALTEAVDVNETLGVAAEYGIGIIRNNKPPNSMKPLQRTGISMSRLLKPLNSKTSPVPAG